MQSMVTNLLQHGDYNVITVHWGDGASVGYIQAVANTRLVGLEITFLIKIMTVKKLTNKPIQKILEKLLI